VFEYNEDELKSTVAYDKIPDKYKETCRGAAAESAARPTEIIEN
jgi:hypothetical protein